MPPSAAYTLDDTVQLGNGQIHPLPEQHDRAVQIRITQGTVSFEANAERGIKPLGCSNRCRTMLVSDTLTEQDLIGFDVSSGPGGSSVRAQGRSEHQPVRVNKVLSAGEFIEYSGGLSVSLTGASNSTAEVVIGSSTTELADQ
jgi:hypothetical protein